MKKKKFFKPLSHGMLALINSEEKVLFKIQTVVVAIIAVAAIEIVALIKGVNGTALSTSLGLIGAMIGWLLRGIERTEKKEEEK